MELFEIEFVCTGNQGRSEPARIFGQDYIVEQRKDGLYRAISSGTLVDEINDFDEGIDKAAIPIEDKVYFIKAGLKNGIFENVRAVENLLRISDLAKAYMQDVEIAQEVDIVYGVASEYFAQREHKERAAALQKLGLETKVKPAKEQTTPRGDVIAIFPMEQRHVDFVNGAYSDSEIEQPYTQCLGIDSIYTQTKPNYQMDVIDKLQKRVPIAVNLAIAVNEEQPAARIEELEEALLAV